jgi:hypothetical protein
VTDIADSRDAHASKNVKKKHDYFVTQPIVEHPCHFSLRINKNDPLKHKNERK